MRFHEWFETGNHIWLILEYCTGGNLMELLAQATLAFFFLFGVLSDIWHLVQDLLLPESSVHDFGLEIVRGLQYLHSNGIIYGNLKPGTVLIDGEGLLKLSDFSLACRVNDSSKFTQSKRVTPAYVAPELFEVGIAKKMVSFSYFRTMGFRVFLRISGHSDACCMSLLPGGPPSWHRLSRNFSTLFSMTYRNRCKIFQTSSPIYSFSCCKK